MSRVLLRMLDRRRGVDLQLTAIRSVQVMSWNGQTLNLALPDFVLKLRRLAAFGQWFIAFAGGQAMLALVAFVLGESLRSTNLRTSSRRF
jgi:hypothetical protein